MCFTTCTGYGSTTVLILYDDPCYFVNSTVSDMYSYGIRYFTKVLRSIFISQTRLRKPPNTARENKNKFVVTFCAWIVEMNLAKEFRIGFHQVG